MTTGEFTEHEFIAGMERKEEPKAETIAISAANTLLDRVREMFKHDGHIMRFMRWAEKSLGHEHMATERGPDPGYAQESEFERTQRLIAREAARAAIEIQTYHEGGGNEGKNISWQTWVLGIVGLMIAGGIGSLTLQVSDLKAAVAGVAATQNTTLAATNQRLEADERRIENLERKVFQ